MKSPVVLFVYNRVSHTKRTINALKNNLLAKDSDLYIFSDAPKSDSVKEKVNEVRKYIRKIDGFKKVVIVERSNNYGLAKSVVVGVTEIINKYGKVIVLEDDIVTSRSFLSFMNDGLDFYKNNKKIRSVTGFNFPISISENFNSDIYISQRPSSWGWGTWIDRWKDTEWGNSYYEKYIGKPSDIREKFNKWGDDLYDMLISQLEGKIDSWAIKWAFFHTKRDQYCVYPVKSMANNIGTDKSGAHSDLTNRYKVTPKEYYDYIFVDDIKESKLMIIEFKKLFKYTVKDSGYFWFGGLIRKLKIRYEKAMYCPEVFEVIINPFFISQRFLSKNINDFSKYLTGKLLDFGCGSRPYEFLFKKISEYVGVDIEVSGHDGNHKKPDVFYDGNRLPFVDNNFDSVFSSQVFEHVVNLDDILEEIKRVLKPDGRLLVTVPFIWNEHETPYDYYRFTSFGLEKFFIKHDFKIEKFVKSGDYLSTLTQLLSLYLHEFSSKKSIFIRWFFQFLIIFPINLFGLIVSKLIPKRHDLYFDNIVLFKNVKR